MTTPPIGGKMPDTDLDDDPCYRSIAEASALIEAGKLSPLALITAEPIAESPTTEAPPLKVRNTSVFDHSHQPSNCAPNGFDQDGMPAVLVFATALFTHALTLRIAHAYQEATDFRTARPPLQAAVLVEDGGRGRAEDD